MIHDLPYQGLTQNWVLCTEQLYQEVSSVQHWLFLTPIETHLAFVLTSALPA